MDDVNMETPMYQGLNQDQWLPQIYQLFDGTLVLHGPAMLGWHDAPIREDKIQVLPRYLRFLA